MLAGKENTSKGNHATAGLNFHSQQSAVKAIEVINVYHVPCLPRQAQNISKATV